MPEKQKINILWFDNDLRIRDNESLFKIMQEDLPFLAVYIFAESFFSSTQYDFKKIGKFRAQFLLETVLDLENNLKQKNIPFLKKFGQTKDIFKQISKDFEVKKIFFQREWTKEEIELKNQIKPIFPDVKWVKSYSQLLLETHFVKEKLDKIPLLFTTFRQKIEKDFKIRTEFDSENLVYDKSILNLKINSDNITLKTLGFNEFEVHQSTAFPFSGGETEGLQRLNSYFFETKNLSLYKETRNGLIDKDYSSKFSAWLANGSLSAVSIFYEIKKYEAEFGSNESTYWLVFELLWRDFFKFTSMQFRNKIFQRNGISERKYECKSDQNLINQWINGETDSDFINANMLEIKNTCWMSNRGRQNVASYFCKILKQDWRIGAAYFEEMLIDHDVHSNYGNWMYLAGVGNDPRSRTFNDEKQAEQYDSEYKFRNLWLQ
ncbi:Cryptochrome DASH [Chryseobacterium sp. MOF25P]|uniref:DASH family cryptochrome n=1 Tax=unclassified Chryseobacterium TaxID=2593645 RepID=UPI000804F8CB|nr:MULTISPECIES: DASH family cryptochrome [unclassified Chryseobacterium]OBW39629.1 Cryptochrome DASH [Chryseobacterium sp. MOF25P]OBW46524.1 Cryptochrome DASH [Chryseobacterium sp. BGARF1]